MKKTFIVCLLICIVMLFVSGCATTTIKRTETTAEGLKKDYSASMTTVFQDFKGSDLEVTLNPNGVNKAKAGAIENNTSVVAADTMKAMLDFLKWWMEQQAMLKAPIVTPAP